jgi:hypothetical protein
MTPDPVVKLSPEQLISELHGELSIKCRIMQSMVPAASHASVAALTVEVWAQRIEDRSASFDETFHRSTLSTKGPKMFCIE